MRFHLTQNFADAQSAYERALINYNTFDDEGPGADERERQASGALSTADTIFFNADAVTPFEIERKFEAAIARGQTDFTIEDYYPAAAIRLDIARLKRQDLSPEFADLWRAWRRCTEDLEATADAPGYEETAEFQQACAVRNQLYCEIAMKDCTSSGDFILKRYLALLTKAGSMDAPPVQTSETANRWDIDVNNHEDLGGRFDIADQIGLYRDIDGTDIGANLLAYGQPCFDAELWLEAAERTGIRVDVVQQREGGWLFGTSIVEPEGDHLNTPAVQRERRRLLRIVSFPGEERHKKLGNEIRENWPSLVFGNPVSQAHLQLIGERIYVEPDALEAEGRSS